MRGSGELPIRREEHDVRVCCGHIHHKLIHRIERSDAYEGTNSCETGVRGLGDTEMTSHGIIVMHPKEFQTKIFIIEDVDGFVVV